MPDFEVQDAQGRKLRMTGETPPTEADIDAAFKAAYPATPAPAAATFLSRAGEGIAGAWEGAKTIAQAADIFQPEVSMPAAQKVLGGLADVASEATGIPRGGFAPTQSPHPIKAAASLLGVNLDNLYNDIKAGQAGAAVGDVVVPAALALAPKAAGLRLPPLLKNANAAERAAVEFGQARGIPVDAATATGNLAVQGGQFLADRSIGGSLIAGRRAAQTQAAVRGVAADLAQQAHPVAMSPEGAGTAVRDSVASSIADLDAAADTAYAKLRTIAKGKAVTVGAGAEARTIELPVSVAKVRPALKPIYNQLKREAELVPLMGDKARALTTLDRLMNGPNVESLEIVDRALGDLKAMARGKGETLPGLRTQGQGIAAEAVKQLDAEVRRVAAAAGPTALKALNEGRAATMRKYQVAEIYDALRTEPVQAFRQGTASGDAHIAQLRDLAKVAPKEMPKLGRAYLDALMEKPLTEGRLVDHGAKLWGDWQKLGPETKRVLFNDPAYVRDLDHFFLLLKRLGVSPNPSGTARTVMNLEEGRLIVTNPTTFVPIEIGASALSFVLHSPRGVRALTKGLRVPLADHAAATAAALQVIQATKGASGLIPRYAGAAAPAPDNRERSPTP